MHKQLKNHIIFGIIFSIITGSLLHFLYDFSNQSALAAIFSPVNESTWEHLKLVFFPMSLFSIYGYYSFGHNYKNYAVATVFGILSAMLTIVILFYTYSGIIGETFIFIDISIFVIAVLTGYFVTYIILKKYSFDFISPFIGILLIEIIFILFVYFTMNPPSINIFTPSAL